MIFSSFLPLSSNVHYVDSIGFKDLQGFLDKKPERPSVLMNLKEKCDAPPQQQHSRRIRLAACFLCAGVMR